MLDRVKQLFNVRGKSSGEPLTLITPGQKDITGWFQTLLASNDQQLNTIGDYLKTGTSRVWPTFKALDIIAQAVQTTPRATYRKGQKTPVEIPDLQRILQYPNPSETFEDLLYRTVFWMKLSDTAFWLKSEATLAGDRPREIYGLNPKRVTRIKNSAGDLLGYTYTVNGKSTPYDVSEIMEFKRPHPDNDYCGLSDYEAGGELVKEFLNRQDWGNKFWKNGAAPSSVMTCETQVSSPENWAKIKAQFQEQYGGKDNAGKTAFLNGKWSIQRLGLTAQEMQDLEQRKLTKEEIFQLHGVPLSVAGIQGAANYATAHIEDRQFRLYTVFPLVRIIESTMNTDLVQGWDKNLRIKFDVAGLVDVQKVMEDFGPAFDRGCITPNELREKLGLGRSDNPMLDQFFIQAAYTPLDMAGVSANGGATDQAAQRLAADFSRKLLLKQ